LLIEAIRLRQESEEQIEVKLAQLDAEAYGLYGVSKVDRALIEREIARRPQRESDYSPSELTNDNDDLGADEKEGEESREDESEVAEGKVSSQLLPAGRTRDLVARWISYYLKQLIETDEDGIVPVWPTRTEPGLIVRVREAIEKDLGREVSDALVAQGSAYLGTSDLNEWLSVSREETIEIGDKNIKLPVGFFPWHLDLYQRRPVFWLLSSEGFEHGRTRFRLQIYLHYLKLTPDTLPRLVSHYLEPVIEDYVQQEWTDAQARAGRLEGKPLAAAKAEAQEWLNTLDALKGFRTAVEAVIQGPSQAQRVSANAKWLSRTIAAVRGGQDLGHGYQPQVDYGVRVNIAPLVEKRLLPKVALKKLGG
jgi:hypothetical protein